MGKKAAVERSLKTGESRWPMWGSKGNGARYLRAVGWLRQRFDSALRVGDSPRKEVGVPGVVSKACDESIYLFKQPPPGQVEIVWRCFLAWAALWWEQRWVKMFIYRGNIDGVGEEGRRESLHFRPKKQQDRGNNLDQECGLCIYSRNMYWIPLHAKHHSNWWELTEKQCIQNIRSNNGWYLGFLNMSKHDDIWLYTYLYTQTHTYRYTPHINSLNP